MSSGIGRCNSSVRCGRLRGDYAAGYLRTVEELVHADLCADFLEMADELLAKGFKDAAAVITGSVLEELLRKLAGIFGVALMTGKAQKADTINGDLTKAGAYNKLEQKNVTAWLASGTTPLTATTATMTIRT